MKTIVINNLQEYYSLYLKEANRYAGRKQRLENALRVFQSKCSHSNTRYQGDPAGGNDSYSICNLCDKVI